MNVGDGAANGCTYPLSASLTSPYTVGSHSALRIKTVHSRLIYHLFRIRLLSVKGKGDNLRDKEGEKKKTGTKIDISPPPFPYGFPL